MTKLKTKTGDNTERIWVQKDIEIKDEIESIPAMTLLGVVVICHLQQIARSYIKGLLLSFNVTGFVLTYLCVYFNFFGFRTLWFYAIEVIRRVAIAILFSIQEKISFSCGRS